ncbi:hypothetical protein BD324DRAFT_38072 [Kockovaella imperatae]|uniref:Uncharacterized protein n=1 Tax=Kockovaella imperatae TaxID=4999 RepID=A0A1Y1UUF5_9TREE|nr:hypothetical protein BD324DRAFT_38072 [Kockovaella imperatae]ORX41096.1 hypothetical protein BD324DRAFT_38072 [Kockovaella imperatae]
MKREGEDAGKGEGRRRKRRRRKEKKRLKKEKKKGTVALTAQWGKYGIISDADIGNKDSEFRAWLVEERKINPETLSKDRTRKEFAVFVEDYNTATLPHEKFYDMRKYDIRMNMIRSGQVIAAEDDKYDPLADVKAHNSTIKSQSAKKESVLSRAELEELRRIEAERVEIAKRRQLGLDVPRHLGVRTEQVTEFTFE